MQLAQDDHFKGASRSFDDHTPALRPPPFEGFAQPSSNTTYCPNQFFDVVLPHFSRGVVRLVGYLLYQTLGWSDRDGRPLRERHQVSYRELIERAGISRGALRQAIDEAVRGNLLRCVRPGRAARAGAGGEAYVLELKWHQGDYTADPSCFQGFFEGSGHRTYIPNQFFVELLPNEPLSVLKVVGAVIRFSIGFEAKRGFRRQQAALSYSAIQRYSRIGSRQDLADALKHAIQANFIERVKAGHFDRSAGRSSEAATYALHWADMDSSPQVRYKTRTEGCRCSDAAGPENVPAQRFGNRTGSGSESEPAVRSKNRTGTEITPENKSTQQQQPAVADGDDELKASLRCLCKAGFDAATAKRLAVHPLDRIQRQLGWMELRNPSRNRLGMLRRAIEEDWPPPRQASPDPPAELSCTARFARHFYAGFAQNKSGPIALPSPSDLTAAEPLVLALQTEPMDATALESWGLKFGRYVAQQAGRDAHGMSLCAAARRFGDAFAVWARHIGERQDKERVAARRAAHEALFKAEYLRYLHAVETRLRDDQPDRYQAFLGERETRRRTLLRFGPQSALLKGFEAEAARLEHFRTFFCDQVLDFAQWDAEHNPEASDSTSQAIEAL